MAKRNVAFVIPEGIPGYLYRVSNVVVAYANIVDAETRAGIASLPVLITVSRGQEKLLEKWDISMWPDGLIFVQLVDTRSDVGYSVTFYFPGDEIYNSKTFTNTPVVPADVVDLANSVGIPAADIPLGCNEMIVMTFDSAPPANSGPAVEDAIRKKLWETQPGVTVLTIRQYGIKSVVFVHGSPILFAVVIVALAICLVAMWTVVIPKILDVQILRAKAKITQQGTTRIADILADPTLTPDQKTTLIEQVLGTEAIVTSTGGTSIIEILKWGVILAGAGVAAYLAITVIGAVGKKKK
jgi:hypothetical protein